MIVHSASKEPIAFNVNEKRQYLQQSSYNNYLKINILTISKNMFSLQKSYATLLSLKDLLNNFNNAKRPKDVTTKHRKY